MSTIESEMRGGIISKLLGKFSGTTEGESVNNNSAPAVAETAKAETEMPVEQCVARLDELTAEKTRLRGIRARELDRKESLDEQIQALDQQRIDALTAFRVDGSEQDKQRAEELFKQIEQLKQDAADAVSIAASVERKMAEIDREVGLSEAGYRAELGKFLDAQMDLLVAVYNNLTPEFTRIVTDIDALYRVMLQCGAGNSNGWWKDARVPTIKPRDGRIYDAILDTNSAEFDAAARDRASEYIVAFKNDGLMWRFGLARGQ